VTTRILTGVAAFGLASPASARPMRATRSASSAPRRCSPTARPWPKSSPTPPASRRPVVESTGTGGGMKIFCQGIGPDHADMTGASRAMKKSEYELCVAPTASPTSPSCRSASTACRSPFRARHATDWNLTEAQIFQALAAEVEVDGKIVANPYKKWNQIDPKLPTCRSRCSARRRPPARATPSSNCHARRLQGVSRRLQALEGDRKNEVCSAHAQDGPFIEAGENDNLIVQRIAADPNALGIFGYSFLYENQDTLKAVKVEGVEPTFDTIADNSYDIAARSSSTSRTRTAASSRACRVHRRVRLRRALWPGGYLSERGLTVLSDALRARDAGPRAESVKMSQPARKAEMQTKPPRRPLSPRRVLNFLSGQARARLRAPDHSRDVAGRLLRRPPRALRGRPSEMHSLPGYHGAFVAVWVGIPAFILVLAGCCSRTRSSTGC
jgi:phosphate transport system substrate-binding protein